MSTTRLPVLPSASSLDRFAACLAAALLTQWPDESSPWADLGTAVHRFLELYGNALKGPHAGMAYSLALREVPAEWRDACAALELDQLPLGPGYVTEESWALDLRTGRARRIPAPNNTDPRGRYAAATLTATEVPMTLDVRGESVPYHADYKRGFLPGNHLHQLMAGACVVADLFPGADTVTSEEIRLAENPHRRIQHVWDRFDLELWRLDWLQRVERARQVVTVGPEHIRPGDHCKHCRARKGCPAHVGLSATFAAAEQGNTSPALVVARMWALLNGQDPAHATITPDMMGKARALAERMRSVANDVIAEQNALCATEDVHLGDKVLVMRRSKREHIIGAVAEPIVREELGAAAAGAIVVETTITKGGVDAAVQEAQRMTPPLVKKGKGAEVKRRIMQRIREAGGMLERESQVPTVMTPAEARALRERQAANTEPPPQDLVEALRASLALKASNDE